MVKYMPFFYWLVLTFGASWVISFYDLANSHFSDANAVSTTLTWTMPPLAEFRRVPSGTSYLPNSETLPVIDNVSSDNKLNMTVP